MQIEEGQSSVPPQPPASNAGRLVLQLGAIAAVFAASPTRAFDLDRFLAPKELALHLTAALAGLFAFRDIRRSKGNWSDLALGAYLLLSVASAIGATNPWLAARAVSLSGSALVLYWTARALRTARLETALVNAVALAVVLAATTSLLQAYGLDLTLFSPNRAPGGTLGNRNFVAHVAALGLPLVILAGLRAVRTSGVLLASFGTSIVIAVLVLTRSRAAWLAAAGAVAIIGASVVLIDTLRRNRTVWRRVTLLGIFVVGSAVAALAIPNTLRWRSENPYLDSVNDIANYEEGSGRGRLIQYGRTLRMAVAHPLLGVGPGNWPVQYPAFAARNDPSMDRSAGGVTYNPWPSSDWVAFVSERGFPAAGLLIVAVVGIAARSVRRLWTTPSSEDALEAAALLATLAATVIAGLFDAVLLLALPAQLAWTAIGALGAPASGEGPATRTAVFALALVVSCVGAARSVAQVAAMEIYARTEDRALLATASRIDPGNYRLHLKIGDRDHGCRAAALFPHAHEPQRRCR